MSTRTDGETTQLLGVLHSQRQHVLGILEGLGDDELRRPVLPSGWSAVALVNHLALDVERFWFQAVVAGDEAVIAEVSAQSHDAWKAAADVTPASVLARYRAEAERADAVVSSASLDTPLPWWPTYWGEWRLADVNAVLLHVITETACHAGHLDAVREIIDGRQWMAFD